MKNLKFLIFFDFFSENVFKSLLRGKETTRKKYQIVFEKFTFFDKKSKKSLKKKSCSKFFEKFKFFIFFKFFSENVLKTLLRGKESTRKKYWIVFEKFTFFEKKSKKSLKKKVFRNFLTYLNFLFFFEFLSDDVLQSF